MGKIRGILFDKDGTLMDFEAIWLPVLDELVEGLAQQFQLQEAKEKLLAAVGVHQGTIDSKSVFATGTGEMTATKLYQCLRELGADPGAEKQFCEKLICDCNSLAQKHRRRIVPIGDVAETIRQLKLRGLYLGIATSDNRESTIFCLEQLGILGFFDFLGTDDGLHQPKPQADLLRAFCQKFALEPYEVAVVGDTKEDLLFAKKSGALAVGVLSGIATEEELREHADLLLPDLNSLQILDCSWGNLEADTERDS